MNDLQYFLHILECLRLKSEEYNLRAISEGPSTEYTFGFLFGEYNRKDSLILSAVEIININKDENFLNYVSSALNFFFQEKIMKSKNKIAYYQNDLNCHKKLPEWKPNYSECYESLIKFEQSLINEYQDMLSKKRIDDFFYYFSDLANKNHIYKTLENWIQDPEYFKSNYSYFCILEVCFNFYIFEHQNLQDFNPKENPLYVYFNSQEINLLTDKNYKHYGLLSLSNDYEPICTEHLECRLYNKNLDITIPLVRKMDNTLFKDFVELYKQNIIKKIAFRPIFSKPLLGKFTTDMALEAVQFGMIFDSNFINLKPSKLIAENFDSLWVVPEPESNEITFEELPYDFDTFNDYVATQVIHLIYCQKNEEFFIKHLDHEIIFYTYEEYDKRNANLKEKGKAKKRQKTFKIDDSEIPFFTDDKPEFLMKILYTFFTRKELLDEYFSKYK